MQTLQTSREGAVETLTLHRPEALNAINAQMLDELDGELNRLHADTDLRCVVVTGSGEKAFAAGADIAAMAPLDASQATAFSAKGQSVLDKLASLSCPVIAAVQGFALGGGCELAMACDVIVASSRAKFGQPEVSLGVLPGFGGTQRLVRRVGWSVALDLCLTGRRIGADEALRVGLVSQVAEDDVLALAQRIAEGIAASGPIAVAHCKRAIHDFADGDLATAQAGERALFGLCFATADQTEGMQAFLEKRKAAFTGT